MKTAVLLLALLLPLVHVRAQTTVKATTRLLPDGSSLTAVTDPDTRTREETIAEAGGKVRSKTIYYLNEQNFAKGATHLDGKGKVRYKESYRFDYAGRKTESRLYAADNRPLGRRMYFYDSKSLVRIEDYDANGNLMTTPARPGPNRSATPEIRRAIPIR